MSLTVEHGRLMNVASVQVGSYLSADAAVGDTVLSVDDAGEFDTEGGSLQINGTVYAYATADLNANTVTLSSGLTMAASDGDPVTLYDLSRGTACAELVGFVALDGAEEDNSDPIVAPFTHALNALVPEGIRTSTGESVTLQRDSDGWKIVDVVATIPVLQPIVAGASPFFEPHSYGATGDGVTDDTAAVQAAIDAATAAGGGTVYLSRPHGWRGTLQVKSGVHLLGAVGSHSGTSGTFNLVALDSTSVLQFGVWDGTNDRPSGATNLRINGNGYGPATSTTSGLVRYACVDATFISLRVQGAGGNAHYFDGAQNNTFISCGTYSCLSGAAWLLDRGAGGNAWFRCETNSNYRGVWFEDSNTSSSDNAYIFGPADNTFHACIFENTTVNIKNVVQADCGNRNSFHDCDIVGTGGTVADGTLVLLTQDAALGASELEFSSCHFSGAGVAQGITLKGGNTCTVRGNTFLQTCTTAFVSDGSVAGASRLILNGRLYGLFQVTNKFGTVNGGSTTAWLIQLSMGHQYTLGTLGGPALTVGRDTDAANRYLLDRDGTHFWRNGSDFVTRQTLGRDSTNNILAVTGGLFVGGRFGLTSAAQQTITTAGQAVTLDASAASRHYLAVTGSASIGSMTISNALDDQNLEIWVATTAGQSITWPTNVRWVSGSAPTSPAFNKWLVVKLTKVKGGSVWIETSANVTVTAT